MDRIWKIYLDDILPVFVYNIFSFTSSWWFFFFFGHFQMIEVDIPQSLFEEQGRQLYGAQLLQIQVGSYKITVSLRRTNLPAIANLQ